MTTYQLLIRADKNTKEVGNIEIETFQSSSGYLSRTNYNVGKNKKGYWVIGNYHSIYTIYAN